MNQKMLLDSLEHAEILTKEVKSILLELDTTKSTTTQAYLNELLLIVRNRLLKDEVIWDESISTPLTLASFENWIRNDFTSYSCDMYFDSINE